jgi:hypothetical protein
MRLYFLSDFFVEDIPNGGAELSDAAIMDYLQRDFVKLKANEVTEIDPDGFYVVSNRSLLSPSMIRKLCELKNYLIIEHDFQFLPHRNPYLYADALAPKRDIPTQARTFYKEAKAVFFQTSFQQNLFEKNGIVGNFINLQTTPYSPSDFKLFKSIVKDSSPVISKAFAVVDSSNSIKNTKGAVKFCKDNNFSCALVPSGQSREDFLRTLGRYATLVFFPTRPESCSRLATEARILGMNVVTTPTYGAPLEEWFSLTGKPLILKLETIIEEGIKTISNYLP